MKRPRDVRMPNGTLYPYPDQRYAKLTTQLNKDRSNKTSSSVVEPCWIGFEGHRRAGGLPRYSALDCLTALLQWAGSRHPPRSLALSLSEYEPSRCSRGRRLPPWLAPFRANHIE